ncbi:MAG: hypothetical protein PF637_14025 [Spirochaetes bacterium]|jgi:hybrid cluster-associated redox disulfide protein|nr:hypothetical protein [Spirochaetota bacterium]
MRIEFDTPVQEALKMSTDVVDVFKRNDLYCPGCHGMSQDTIKTVIVNNGLDPDKFLKELNESVK